MSGSLRPYGVGLYSVNVWPEYRVVGLAGVATLGFIVTAELLRTWQQPTQMCETGTWTPTTLPSGPPNDLDLAA